MVFRAILPEYANQREYDQAQPHTTKDERTTFVVQHHIATKNIGCVRLAGLGRNTRRNFYCFERPLKVVQVLSVSTSLASAASTPSFASCGSYELRRLLSLSHSCIALSTQDAICTAPRSLDTSSKWNAQGFPQVCDLLTTTFPLGTH